MEIINITEQENVRLRGIIAKIGEALDDGRYGDIRKLVRTGSDKPVIPITGVIARNGR
jgi:hypothetical protein